MTCPACGARNEGSPTVCASCGVALDLATEVAAGEPLPATLFPDLAPGTLFHGRYEILGMLGRGGMGRVYRAHDRTLDEQVAIKVLRPELADDATMAERFKSEIKLARKVRHRNVCAIHDFGEDRGVLYISMEMIDGVDLRQVLRERGSLPPAEAYDVATQVAEGLQAVHAAGIIHRDLKASNIVVDKAGIARLMDFGIAKRQEGSGTLTGTGRVLGTPEYMSPEQAQGKRVDLRTDIYALGVVIYEIFAGEVPFRGETPIATILMQLHDPPPLDHPSLPPRLRPLLRRALAKDPSTRPATASAMAAALRDAQSAVPASAATEVPAPRVRPSPGRPVARARAGRAWLIGLPVAAALVIAVAVGLRVASQPRTEPSPAVTTSTVGTPPATPQPFASAPTAAMEPPAATARPPAATPRRAAESRPQAQPTTPAVVPAAVAPPPSAPPATQAAGPGQLQLAVRPWAEVDVDGRTLGSTPLDRVSLPSGTHTVVLRHPSYAPYSRAVTIRPGELTKLMVDLARDGTPRD